MWINQQEKIIYENMQGDIIAREKCLIEEGVAEGNPK